MWRNLFIVVLVCIIGYNLTYYFDKIQKVPHEKTASVLTSESSETMSVPAFNFTAMNGETHSLSDFKGKTILLNFWATWCAPCIVEFPKLLDIAETYKDEVVLLALSSDMDKAPVQRFVEKHNITADNIFIALDETGVTQEIFKTYKLPETLIIDPDQNIRGRLVGADWEIKELKDLIESF